MQGVSMRDRKDDWGLYEAPPTYGPCLGTAVSLPASQQRCTLCSRCPLRERERRGEGDGVDDETNQDGTQSTHQSPEPTHAIQELHCERRDSPDTTPFRKLRLLLTGDVVLLPGQHDLWGAVVASGDVTRHLWILETGETKVADLEVAVLVDEDVGRLQISVDDTGGMGVFEAALL